MQERSPSDGAAAAEQEEEQRAPKEKAKTDETHLLCMVWLLQSFCALRVWLRRGVCEPMDRL